MHSEIHRQIQNSFYRLDRQFRWSKGPFETLMGKPEGVTITGKPEGVTITGKPEGVTHAIYP